MILYRTTGSCRTEDHRKIEVNVGDRAWPEKMYYTKSEQQPPYTVVGFEEHHGYMCAIITINGEQRAFHPDNIERFEPPIPPPPPTFALQRRCLVQGEQNG